MILPAFEYFTPSDVQEVVTLLQQYGNDAKVLAGGQSLLPVLKLGITNFPVLIDLGGIDSLRGIALTKESVTIGAMATHAELEEAGELRLMLPLLSQAATLIGDPMVRNRGTFGGSLAHADPAADWPAVALALNARLKIRGSTGERTILIDDFFVDLLTTALLYDEIVTQIEIPLPHSKTGMTYQKYPHPASGYAVAGVAAIVTLDEHNICQDCRIGITGVGPKAIRVTATEEFLKGRVPTLNTLRQAAELADTGREWQTENNASRSYRAHLARVYTRRALEIATLSVR
jgi:carbon-monoxide dehydrogenase medium subunit